MPFEPSKFLRRRPKKDKDKDKDDDDDDDAPVAKHTASKTRNMYPPVYASVVETTVLPMFSFLFETEFNYTSSGYYICRNPFWNAAERTPRKVTKSACVFIMMMSFLLLNWKNWISFERQKDKKRGILRIRENANAFCLPHHRSTGVEIKGTQHDGKEAERAGRFVFSDEYPHTHTHTHTHIKREKEEALYLIDDF